VGVIWNGIVEAMRLLVRGDVEVLRIAALTLRVSGTATLFAVAVGVPLGTALGLVSFRGRRAVVSVVNLGMGLPPVVVGLWVSIFLWRYGPFGFLHLLYTPAAMIVAQATLALPIVTALTMAAVQQLDPRLRLQVLALGASRPQFLWCLWREARFSLMAAVMAGFGGAVSEVGASMMVGGNMLGRTRVLTTATVMEVARGNYALAIALSIILLVIAYLVVLALTLAQQRRRPA
jgi:tungstate transport system permease protein